MTNEQLNKASQVVFMFACLALVALASVRVWNESHPGTSVGADTRGPLAQQGALAPGTKLPPLDGVSYETSAVTVAVVLQSRCAFCAASMPFYQQLAKLRGASGFQLVAASAESTRTTTDYLKQRGVEVDAVATLKGSEIPTSGTPTLVLIGKGGVIMDSWLGQLSAAQEAEVTARITSALRNAA
jgi:hypothetical protein